MPTNIKTLEPKLDELQTLNRNYQNLNPDERIQALFSDFDRQDILLTSSFGTTAVYLLHILHKNKIKHPVYFIDTRYHFEETYQYKQALKKHFDLDLREVLPSDWKNDMTTKSRLWETHPDLCCSINKVEPLDTLRDRHKVWVSGLMNWQSDMRQSKEIFELKKRKRESEETILKFYPIIDVAEGQIQNHIQSYALPLHPLKNSGYESIGCKQCTIKGQGRIGRWAGTSKTECGLHK